MACASCGSGVCLAGACSSPAPPPATDAGSGGMCANLGCFDIFDCAIYHPAEFGPCGFTQCVGLICTK
jgi:hypothetical protein